jgi:hypothetical protein
VGLAFAAQAQVASPSVAPFPLEVTRPVSLTDKQRDDLQATLKVLIRRSGASVPDSAKLTEAKRDLKREDCDRDNECLAQLASLSGSLYALYAAVDLTAEKNVVAVGRVVRDDGKLVADVAAKEQVTFPLAHAQFSDVAERALVELLSRLKLRDLPVAKPMESTPPLAGAMVPMAGDTATNVPPPMEEGFSRRTAGIVVGGVGVAGLVIGSIMFGLAQADRGSFKVDSQGNIPLSAKPTVSGIHQKEAAGTALLGVGAALALAGGLMWFVAPSNEVHAGIAPVEGGAFAVIGGNLP